MAMKKGLNTDSRISKAAMMTVVTRSACEMKVNRSLTRSTRSERSLWLGRSPSMRLKEARTSRSHRVL